MIRANSEECQPRPRFTRQRILYITGILVAASVSIVLLSTSLSAGWQRLATNLIFSLVFANCIGWLAWIVTHHIGARTSRLKPVVQWAVFLGSMVVVAIVGSLVAFVILAAFNMIPWSSYWTSFWNGLQFNIVVTLVIGVISYLYESLRYRAQYETTLARLSSLESRLQPHFLFNTLNSILALIPEDPAAAERMTERLAVLLRFSLDATDRNTVRLEHELKVMTDYLEIEKARFGHRLQYSVDVPPALMKAQVPPFSLQTLVENSVKYGGNEIRVSAGNGNGRLMLKVWDSGQGFTKDSILPGHGLDNLRSRLSALWGRDARMDVRRENSGSSVELSIPVVWAE